MTINQLRQYRKLKGWLLLLKDPHGLDEDSGLPHIWHIITNAAFLCELDKPTEAGTFGKMCKAFRNLGECIKGE